MNITIPIECSDGHQFLLKLTDCRNLPIESEIEIVDITLIDVARTNITNNAGTLNRIASILFNFLDENDVILYFYCSKDPIKKSKNRADMSYQQYRHSLFCAMFSRITRHSTNCFVDKSIILKDNVYGDHYIHLMSKIEYLEMLDKLENHINEFNK